MPARRSSEIVIVAAIALAACNRGSQSGADGGAATGKGAASSSSVAQDASTAAVDVDAGFTSAAGALEPTSNDAGAALRALVDAPKAGAVIEIAAGSFASGSTQGDEGRDPSLEPALVDVTLGAFAIDALPYPNDPAAPLKTGASLDEAARLCRDRGARLCTELEWERACKGADNDAYASGPRWNTACEKERARCSSASGARAMGTMPELTDSRFVAEAGDGAPVLRGGARRCAARGKGSGGGGETGFRCCKGAPNAVRIGAIESRPGFKKVSIEPAQLAKIFAQVPELARIGSDLRYFTEGDVRAMTARSGAAHEGIHFVTTPILWSPETGSELLVATGRGKSMSFVVALWTLPKDRYRFASSFLMLNDLSPVALAFENSHRKELHWTSCWGCNGEQGLVSYRPEEHRVVIVQQ